MPAAEGRAYWTYAECLTWVCTRNLQRANEIRAPASANAVWRVYWRYGLEKYLPTNDDGTLANEE
jgi:hypothetical protein